MKRKRKEETAYNMGYTVGSRGFPATVNPFGRKAKALKRSWREGWYAGNARIIGRTTGRPSLFARIAAWVRWYVSGFKTPKREGSNEVGNRL